MCGLHVGAGLGGAGGWLASRYGWSAAFHIMGMAGLCYTVVVASLLHDAPRGTTAVQLPGEKGAKPPPRTRTTAGTAMSLPLPRPPLPLPATGLGAQLLAALVALVAAPGFVTAAWYWGLLGVASWAVKGWMPTYLQETYVHP